LNVAGLSDKSADEPATGWGALESCSDGLTTCCFLAEPREIASSLNAEAFARSRRSSSAAAPAPTTSAARWMALSNM